jgi:hypothetical protein
MESPRSSMRWALWTLAPRHGFEPRFTARSQSWIRLRAPRWHRRSTGRRHDYARPDDDVVFTRERLSRSLRILFAFARNPQPVDKFRNSFLGLKKGTF